MADCCTNDIANFCINQGTTWIRQATWAINGTPVNLTGYTARMFLRRDVNDAAPAFQLTTANGRIVLTTPASGIFTMTISDDDTETLSGEYVYDLEVESAGGVITRLFKGRITINQAVTR